MNRKIRTALTMALVLDLCLTTAWAGGSRAIATGPAARHAESPDATRSNSTSDILANLVNHAEGLELRPDQIATLKAIQLDLDLARIKAEADILLTEREIAGMIMDDQVDLSVVEAKIAQSVTLAAGLRVSGARALRQAMAVLTPAQREKLRGVAPKPKREEIRS